MVFIRALQQDLLYHEGLVFLPWTFVACPSLGRGSLFFLMICHNCGLQGVKKRTDYNKVIEDLP